jgi:hypothetical protein
MNTSATAWALSFASAIVLTPALALAQATPQLSATPQTSALTSPQAPKTTPYHFKMPQHITLSSSAPQPSAWFVKLPMPAFQETPAPVAQPEASATPAASPGPQASAPVDITSLVKHSNPNFNPCGGWRQMLVSYAPATNCVLDAGEVFIGVNYLTTYVPLGSQIVLNGATVTTTTNAHIHAYPFGTAPIGVGIGGRWQFSYTPPEYQDIIGYNGNVNKSGTTNQIFSFRNMFYFNRCFTYCGGDGLSAVILTYIPPTGSEAWRGIGPSYSVAFSSTVAVQKSPSGKGRILINLYDPVTYSSVSSTASSTGGPGRVTYGFSSNLITTMIWIHHSWRLNTSIGYAIPGHQWFWNLNPNYLISRRLVVGLNYGGAGVSLTNNFGVGQSFLALTNTTRPRFLLLSLYYLIGHTIPLIKGLPQTDVPGD